MNLRAVKPYTCPTHLCGLQCTANVRMMRGSADYNIKGSEPMTTKAYSRPCGTIDRNHPTGGCSVNVVGRVSTRVTRWDDEDIS